MSQCVQHVLEDERTGKTGGPRVTFKKIARSFIADNLPSQGTDPTANSERCESGRFYYRNEQIYTKYL